MRERSTLASGMSCAASSRSRRSSFRLSRPSVAHRTRVGRGERDRFAVPRHDAARQSRSRHRALRHSVGESPMSARRVADAFALSTDTTRIGERLPMDLWAQLSPAVGGDDLSARIKRTFDPSGVLNPGHPRRRGMSSSDGRSAECALPGSPLAKETRGHRRVRALRFLPAGVSDVSDARGRERQSARPHRADAIAARRHAAARRTRASRRTSTSVSAVARARPCVRRACRTDICSRRRARRWREHRPIPAIARVILSVFQHPWLMRLAMVGGRVTRATGIARALSEAAGPRRIRDGDAGVDVARAERAGAETPTSNGSRGNVALLTGCVMEGLFAPANRATERVLLANDYSLTDGAGPALLRRAARARRRRRAARGDSRGRTSRRSRKPIPSTSASTRPAAAR